MKLNIKQSAALNEKGGRFKNEDFIYPLIDSSHLDLSVTQAIPNIPGLFMVSDGVGGDRKGEIAAQMVTAEFARYFDLFPPSSKVTYGYLSAALLRTEEALSNYLLSHPESENMATTLALLYLDEHGATLAWVGDSRIYLFREGKMLFQTTDEIKALPEHVAKPITNRLIMGTHAPTDLEVKYIPPEDIRDDDIFFICSDGVYKEFSEEQMGALFLREKDVESIRQQIFTHCNGVGSDNFSCYMVQLEKAADSTPVIALTPPSSIEDDPESISSERGVDNISVEEPPEVIEKQAHTNWDSWEKKETSEKEPETVLERLAHRERSTTLAPVNQQSPSDDNASQQGSAKADESPKPDKGSTNFIIPLLLVALLLTAAAILFNTFKKNGKANAYTTYTEKALKAQERGKYNLAILYADSAFQSTEELNEKNEARKIANALIEEKTASLQTLIDKAVAEQRERTYPGYWKAKQYYEEALRKHGDLSPLHSVSGAYPDLNTYRQLADAEAFKAQIDACNTAMSKIKLADVINQMSKVGAELCQKGKPEEAAAYFEEANKLVGEDEKLGKRLTKAQTICKKAEEIAAARRKQAAEKQLSEAQKKPVDKERSLPAVADSKKPELPKESPEATKPSTEKPREITDPNNKKIAAVIPTKEATVSRSEQKEVSRRSPKPTAEQLGYLKKGKTLFEKVRQSQSVYEERKAAEYLQKAGPALDGQGYYMLANIYRRNQGVKKDPAKALAYAQKSALAGYPSGHYYYAILLLNHHNKVDSLTAKRSLNTAASKGHFDASNKLYELQSDLNARRRSQ